jgi:hypothetical protein
MSVSPDCEKYSTNPGGIGGSVTSGVMVAVGARVGSTAAGTGWQADAAQASRRVREMTLRNDSVLISGITQRLNNPLAECQEAVIFYSIPA